MTSFDQMGLIAPILKSLSDKGYTTPTPIQAQAIPHLLQGADLLGCAQTGTGKTAAFSIPILQRMYEQKLKGTMKKGIKTLILTPTRELAIQIEENMVVYGSKLGLNHLVIFGGVSQVPQVGALQRGVDILVATPGRLLDLIQQGYVHLHHVETFVLDEADRMLDMGFVHDVKRVITKLPTKRQTLFFSATMPPDIQHLANSILTNPVHVAVTPAATTAETISQYMYLVEKNDKKLLLAHLLDSKDIKSALVFTRTKHGADRVAKDLDKLGIQAQAIHGNKSQNARQNALKNFKEGNTRVLVATDIAARGIDISELGHVINFELPNIPETYVHRIGRTGRAGFSGTAFSFCEGEEWTYLKDIQKLIGKPIPVDEEHPWHVADLKPLPPPVQGGRQQQRDGRRDHNQRKTSGNHNPISANQRRRPVLDRK